MAKRDQLRDRYHEVTQRVAEAAVRAGRRADDILTIAVTKYATPDQIRQIVDLGHRDLGESRVQQLQQRVATMEEMAARRRLMGDQDRPAAEVRWHMVGHVQRNKVRQLIPLVRLVHSVDSLRLAEELQQQADRLDREVEVLLQIDIGVEDTKQGVAVAAAPHLGELITSMMHLRLRGLMTMAPYSEDGSASAEVFHRCADLFNEMQTSGRFGPAFNVLSMGMTNDFEQAIAAGANMIRIGRALFGEPVAAETT